MTTRRSRKDSYNNIEVTDEEMQSLQDETTESNEVQEPQEQSSEETSYEAILRDDDESLEDDEIDAIEIDGEQYTLDDIQGFMDDSKNKSEWNKTNTQKAQELAKYNKLVKKLEDTEFKEHIKDFFFDNKEEYDKLDLDGLKALEVEASKESPQPEQKSTEIDSELNQRLEKLESVENERDIENRTNVLSNQLDSLENKYPDILQGENTNNFLSFMYDNEITDMDVAFRIWAFDTVQSKLGSYTKLDDNRARNQGKVVGTSPVGAKEVRTPQKYTNWKDITLDDPEIKKYFEK